MPGASHSQSQTLTCQHVCILHVLARVYATRASTCVYYTCQHVYILHVLARVYTTRASTCVLYTCQHVCLLHVLDYYSKTCLPDWSPPDDPARPCRPKAGYGLVIIMTLLKPQLCTSSTCRPGSDATDNEPTNRSAGRFTHWLNGKSDNTSNCSHSTTL